MSARVEQMIRSLDASEAKEQAEERKLESWRRDMFAAVDERDRRKSGLSPEEWAALKRQRASEGEALRAARQRAKDQQGCGSGRVLRVPRACRRAGSAGRNGRRTGVE